MANICEIFIEIEKKPDLYLGNNYGIVSLNHFLTGLSVQEVSSILETLNYPDFSLFTDWVGGMLKSKYEGSAIKMLICLI